MIELTYIDDEGEEVILKLPSIMEVCEDCDGHGSVLCDGMRGHAYSIEEFDEAFSDDEDREAYFTRGGKYDQPCPTCKGENVVPVVDEDKLSEEQKQLYAKYEEYEEDKACGEAEDRRTRWYEDGCPLD